MTHHTTPEFWDEYDKLPKQIQRRADENFVLLRSNPRHPSLHFKQIRDYWSVRVGLDYRALAIEDDNDELLWFWIGHHNEYDKLLRT